VWDHCGVISGCLLFLILCSSGFQDLLRLKPPSLLMLSGCILITSTSVLLTQYCAGDKIEKNEMGRAFGAYGGGEGAYRVLVGKPKGRRPLGRPRRRWVDNIRMDLQEVGCGYVDWIGLSQDLDRRRTLVSTVMNLRVP